MHRNVYYAKENASTQYYLEILRTKIYPLLEWRNLKKSKTKLRKKAGRRAATACVRGVQTVILGIEKRTKMTEKKKRVSTASVKDRQNARAPPPPPPFPPFFTRSCHVLFCPLQHAFLLFRLLFCFRLGCA